MLLSNISIRKHFLGQLNWFFTLKNDLENENFTFQYGIVINLLWQSIQSDTTENFTALFITFPCWNVNPKTQKMLDWKSKPPHFVKAIQNSAYGVVLDCFNMCEIGLDFSIQHFWCHWITSIFRNLIIW